MMARFLYACLLRLHPRRFRQRYAAEMLWIFDQSAENRSARLLFADALLSLIRQWVLRPELPEPAAVRGAAPAFHICGNDTPRAGALLYGALLSVAVFGAISLTIGPGRHSKFLFGSRDPAGSEYAVPRRTIPVLVVLDANHDGVISASEIANAPEALRKLDKNGDGKLSAAECGVSFRSMRLHPVLAVLDADHDGEISVTEIQNAPAALRTLDRNGDGKLTAEELVPRG